jgi:hypothetical protein
VSPQSAFLSSWQRIHFCFEFNSFLSEFYLRWCLLLITYFHNLSKNLLFLLFYGSHDAYLLFHLTRHPDLSSNKDLMSCLYYHLLLGMHHDYALEELILHFFILVLFVLFILFLARQLNLNS